jgi:hypothetical protein
MGGRGAENEENGMLLRTIFMTLILNPGFPRK